MDKLYKYYIYQRVEVLNLTLEEKTVFTSDNREEAIKKFNLLKTSASEFIEYINKHYMLVTELQELDPVHLERKTIDYYKVEL